MYRHMAKSSVGEPDDLCFVSGLELRDAIRRREISPVEATEAVLRQIERVNPLVNAYVTVLAEEALAAATRAEREVAAGNADQLGALHGVPMAVKDLTPTANVRTTFGAPITKDHVPDTDSLAWARLKAAGCVLIGKTTTPEFGMRGITESELTGVTRNPWNLERTAGGSSGGSAVAAATGMAHLTWGSDGGGSIRIPSAYCGVVGLKASVGRIPLAREESPFESAVAVGPITRTVADNALLVSVTAGPSIHEPYGLPAPDVDLVELVMDASVRGLRVAYCPDIGGARVSREVRAVVDAAAQAFEEDLGARVDMVEMDLPDPIEHFLGYWAPGMAAALASPDFAGYDPPPAIKQLAEVGSRMSAVEFATAIDRRRAIAAGFAKVFEAFDLLLTPTSPVAPFPHPGDIGGNTEVDGVPVEWPSFDFHRITEPFSHAGVPAITLPCGFTEEVLPVGLQIGATYHRDDLVLRAAAAYEAATPWHERRPPVVG
jgi:Asp-tRNA(Asn)/Glu-tRNA(Gln) amidotransferase A subunit family amidase